VGFTDPAAEIRRLQREVEYLRRQREILKKAVSILSEDPQSGMR
jgi:transposase-like protein